MKSSDPWSRLVAAARRAPDAESAVLTLGYTTRIASLGLGVRREPADFWGIFGTRALGVALAVLMTLAAVSYPSSRSAENSGGELDDPVAELVAQL